MKQILLINVSGQDKPGVTRAVTDVLSSFNVTVLDIGQAVIHDQLNLGILAAVPKSEESDALITAVEGSLSLLGMQVMFSSISEERYQDWVEQQGKARYIVTLLARKIEADHLAAVATVTSEYGLNIDKIVRLSGRIKLNESDQLGRACVEFSVRGEPKDAVQFKSALLELASNHDIDIAYQQDNIFRRNRRLVVFDMDSTLIDAEVIDELAHEAGVGDQVAANPLTHESKDGPLVRCFLCSGPVTRDDVPATCPSCDVPAHFLCLADRLLEDAGAASSVLVPTEGCCPYCQGRIVWSDIVAERSRIRKRDGYLGGTGEGDDDDNTDCGADGFGRHNTNSDGDVIYVDDSSSCSEERSEGAAAAALIDVHENMFAQMAISTAGDVIDLTSPQAL